MVTILLKSKFARSNPSSLTPPPFSIPLPTAVYETSGEMQAARNAIRLLRASSPRPSAVCGGEGGLLYAVGSRAFSQPAVACPALEKQEVTDRVLNLLRSIPSIDPSKVSPTASFKNDMQLDMLDNVDVMVAVEEEFAVDIPNSEAAKISTTAHLIDYIAGHPQAK